MPSGCAGVLSDSTEITSYCLTKIKTATLDKCLIRVFNVIDRSPLQLGIGAGAVLCMADKFSALKAII